MKVKVLKLIAGWNAKVGDVIVMPDEFAKPLIEAGNVEPVNHFDKELAMWGLATISSQEKELIKFACDLFDGVIVDVGNTRI